MKKRFLFVAMFAMISTFTYAQVPNTKSNGDLFFYFDTKNEDFVITDANLNILQRSKSGAQYNLSEGLAAVEFGVFDSEEGGYDNYYGFINNKNKIVIPIKFKKVENFVYGVAVVFINNRYCLIDKTGKEVLALDYDVAFSLGTSRIIVKKGNQYSAINRSGAFVKNLKYDNIYPPRQDLCRVVYKEKYGFIDTAGVEVIPATYAIAESFSSGLALVGSGAYGFGFINKTGKVIVPLIYQNADPFSEGLAAVQEDELWGYIDITGKVVIPIKYYEAANFSDGKAQVKDILKTTDSNGKAIFTDDEFFIDKNGLRIK